MDFKNPDSKPDFSKMFVIAKKSNLGLRPRSKNLIRLRILLVCDLHLSSFGYGPKERMRKSSYAKTGKGVKVGALEKWKGDVCSRIRKGWQDLPKYEKREATTVFS
jgi:hypothetical protein